MNKNIIFLCWAGRASKSYALLFKKYLKLIIPKASPFISSDIKKGRAWLSEILRKLYNCGFALLFITKGNKTNHWIHFESGAVCKGSLSANLSPILIDINSNNLKTPLSLFQATRLKSNDIQKLFKDINKSLKPRDNDKSFREKWLAHSPAFLKEIRKILERNNKNTNTTRKPTKINKVNIAAKIDTILKAPANPMDLLIGRWEHRWDPGYRNNSIIVIEKDGKYTADRGNRTTFQIQNPNIIGKQVIFDLWDIVGRYKDSTQILDIKTPDLLEGYLDVDHNNPRKYIRIP